MLKRRFVDFGCAGCRLEVGKKEKTEKAGTNA
jgi:hypothetical protein